MRVFRKLRRGFGTCVALVVDLWRGPNWWLVPVVLILLPAAAILVVLEAYPVVSPFLYQID